MKFEGLTGNAGFFNSHYASLGRRSSVSGVAHTWELLLCQTQATVCINEQQYSVIPGDLICLCPEDAWKFSLPFQASYVRVLHTVDDLAKRMQGWADVFTVRDVQAVKTAMQEIACAQQRQDELGLAAALLSLIVMLDKEQQRDALLDAGSRKKTRDSIRAGVEYIEQHYREKCTLNQIAAYADRSPIYFHDVFRDVMGITPYEYIAQLRLEEAKRLLSMSDMDPCDIAEYCGFCSQSYFNFVFKKAMGVTPLNYRRAAVTQYLDTQNDD
ncbi:MAG: helix-turn-helix transcriptional regulator [Clostridia bacterium]|nr:helix-turn-helix transcriptional regulator [Clostridia bacterium]